ncbi:hypothetical protein Dsin_024452 [Dipteronia sinensis]|uniref:Uncharacterized protein n=1 Tax=Dipteronia sinensis TaxID=43782 RepID=A0AAE0DW25_9ROSI|nr:hypothetical protein Dsin_024452 [Dipteronia sinensis]
MVFGVQDLLSRISEVHSGLGSTRNGNKDREGVGAKLVSYHSSFEKRTEASDGCHIIKDVADLGKGKEAIGVRDWDREQNGSTSSEESEEGLFVNPPKFRGETSCAGLGQLKGGKLFIDLGCGLGQPEGPGGNEVISCIGPKLIVQLEITEAQQQGVISKAQSEEGKEVLATEEVARREIDDEESKLNFFDSKVIKSLGGSLLTKGVGVEARGTAGGIITLWNEDYFEVKACISNDQCIIVSGVITKLHKPVVFCNIYAENIERERIELWKFILNAQVSLHGPERKGGGVNNRSMMNFRRFSDLAKVIEIPMQDVEFTWSNNREVESWARLDRFLCDPILLSWFPMLVQKGLSKSLSDHNPIMLDEPVDDWGPRPFRFLNIWLEDKHMMKGVHNAKKGCTNGGSYGFKLHYKAKAAKISMKARLKEKFPPDKQVNALKGDLAEIDQKATIRGWTIELWQERSLCLVKLWKFIRLEERKWSQI